MNSQGSQDAFKTLAVIAARIHELERDASHAKRRETDALIESQLVSKELLNEQVKAAKILEARGFGTGFAEVLADLKRR